MSLLCNSLRTSQVEINGVTVVLTVLGGFEKVFRVVGTELDKQRTVTPRAFFPVHVGRLV